MSGSAGGGGAGAGRVVGIYVGPTGLVEQATAVAGRGLEGDRYFAGTGFFYRDGKKPQVWTAAPLKS